jgi:hypothetical protein
MAEEELRCRRERNPSVPARLCAYRLLNTGKSMESAAPSVISIIVISDIDGRLGDSSMPDAISSCDDLALVRSRLLSRQRSLTSSLLTKTTVQGDSSLAVCHERTRYVVSSFAVHDWYAFNCANFPHATMGTRISRRLSL